MNEIKEKYSVVLSPGSTKLFTMVLVQDEAMEKAGWSLGMRLREKYAVQ